MAFAELSSLNMSQGLSNTNRTNMCFAKRRLCLWRSVAVCYCLPEASRDKSRRVDDCSIVSFSVNKTNRWTIVPVKSPLRIYNQLNSDCGAQWYDVDEKDDSSDSGERLLGSNGTVPSGSRGTEYELTEIPSTAHQLPDIRHELIMLSLPAIAGQAIEPLTQLMETAYIGRLGSVELASAGISISLFNIISKLFNIPLLSVATSFVAKDISENAINCVGSEGANGRLFEGGVERRQLSSVPTALLLAVGIGIVEALALSLGSPLLLSLMGISHDSSMYGPAQKFLALRALGAPAFVVSLALQGVFRGFKDTKTPVFCLGFGNFLAIFLFPLLMYYFGLGVSGAAISTVISQYLVTFSMIWHLNKKAVLLPPKLDELQFGGYLKSGGFLIGRTFAVLLTMTLGTSIAARQGSVAMASHQICLQVWLAVSLLTDALATSAQALIASYLAKGDYIIVKEITHFVLKIGFVVGISLAAILGVSFSSLTKLFTKDAEVLRLVGNCVLVYTDLVLSPFPFSVAKMIVINAFFMGNCDIFAVC